jgi:hypothetical protein
MDDHGAGQQRGGSGRKRWRVLTSAVVLSLAPVVLSFFLNLKTALGYDNLLRNGGFEQGTSGWTAAYGTTFITVTDPVSLGNWAAAISGTTGSVWIYQDVDIIPGATYTLSGWVYKDEDAYRYALLRIEWWPTGSGMVESGQLTDDNDFYRPITAGPAVAPLNTSKARIKLIANIRTANPSDPIYFDELSLTSSIMPRGFLPLSLKSYPR